MITERYFRYLFENVPKGVVHTGCIWDRERDKTFNFVYISETTMCANNIPKAKTEEFVRFTEDSVIDLFVLGAYSADFLKKMMELVNKHTVKNLVLPYLAPIQRLQLANKYSKMEECDDQLMRFLQEPYQFLKKSNVETIFFLYGNGEPIKQNVDDLERGVFFEMADAHVLDRIREMEGAYVPVVKAGYIIENDWVFYFGCYGKNLLKISQFTRDYSQNHRQMRSQIEDLLKVYAARFGMEADAGIVMFHGPQNAKPGHAESLFTAKAFEKEQNCESEISHKTSNCTIKCLYRNDYDVLKRHMDKARTSSCYGALLLNGKDISGCMAELKERFESVRAHIRTVSVPVLSANQQYIETLLKWIEDVDRKYWVCGNGGSPSAELAKLMLQQGPHHKFVGTNSQYGYCFSGYLISNEK